MPETLTRCNLCASREVREIDRSTDIWQCRECGYVFDNQRPTREEIVSYYSVPRKYDPWLDREAERDMLWARRLRKVDRCKKAGTLLDIGAGIGQFLHVARGAFSELHGTEVSKSAVAIAGERYGLSLARTEIEAADFAGKRFDNITLFHVLEHVHDPDAVIDKCFSVLADGGMLFVAVPNDLASLRNKTRKLLSRLGVNKIAYAGKLGLPKIRLDGSLPEIHLSHFTPRVLRKFLEAKGFTIVENGLDPYYAESGSRLFLHALYYGLLSMLHRISGINLYDTIWVAAKKSGIGRPGRGENGSG